MSSSDRLLSIVRLSVCLLTFHIFIFVSRTTGLMSANLGTKHLWAKGVQFCSNEGSCLCPRGDNNNLKKNQIQWVLELWYSHVSVPRDKTSLGTNIFFFPCDLDLLVLRNLTLWPWPSLELAIIWGNCVSQTHFVSFKLPMY